MVSQILYTYNGFAQRQNSNKESIRRDWTALLNMKLKSEENSHAVKFKIEGKQKVMYFHLAFKHKQVKRWIKQSNLTKCGGGFHL